MVNMPNYKLTYFNGRGRAEVVRILFEVAGVKYEDVRIEGDKWPQLKPKTPFGQLPILEIDGKVVGQSKAISRYLAREFGLYGHTSCEALQVDVALECCDELVQPLQYLTREKDEEKKKQLAKTCYDESVPKYLKNLNYALCQNADGDAFFVGDKISLADVCFLVCVDRVTSERPDALDAFPKLKSLLDRIKSNEKIAAWLQRRPKTLF